MIAVSCGTPTPVTTRVVQIEPGPTPTFTASTPRSTSARAPSRVATLPATSWTSGNASRTHAVGLEHAVGVAVRRVDHEHVDARIDQRPGAVEEFATGADRRRHAQPAVLVLVRVRVLPALVRCP